MADEIPISDVLCEAMEYLSKLGLNLRTRSESLKEKKINKKKLKNAHAVRQAANKVLLICELSKKSLENVENGVKNILSVVSTQSSAVGGKSLSPAENNYENINEYQILECGSQKIKIPKKVPLKHYMSVKVQARNMSMSTQKNYPVYYDCKLYRLRKKKEKRNLLTDSDIMSSNDVLQTEIFSDDDKQTSTLNASNNELENPLKHCDNKVSEESDNNASNEVSNHDNEKSYKPLSREKLGKTKSSKDSTSSEKLLDSKSIEHESSENVEKVTKEDSVQTSTVDKPKKFKHIKVIDDDSNSSDELSNKIVTALQTKPNILDTDIIVSDNENINLNKENNFYNKTENGIDKVDINNESHNKTSNLLNNEQKSDKPLIKCVSINKLLKPDVLLKTENKKSKQHFTGLKKDNIPSSKHAHRIERKQNKEEEFWVIKRKEVRNFKPKKVVVNITRLPKLTESFLSSFNLTKVTQNGDLVIQVSHPLNPPLDTNYKVSKNNSEENGKLNNTSDIEKVKNDLLNDSDSEKNMDIQSENIPSLSKDVCNTSTRSTELQNAKKMLLNDSESDTEKDVPNEDNNCKDRIENNTENKIEHVDNQSCLNVEKPDTDKEQEKIKSSLLNESSDDDSSEHVPIKRKRLHKKNDETLEAKKKLMSSSSDSETETKTSSETVKSSFTKGNSSPEGEQFKHSNKVRVGNVYTSSDSEVDTKLIKDDSGQDEKEKSNIDEQSEEKMSDSRGHQTSSCKTNSDTQDASDKDSDSDYIDRLANLNSLQKKSRRRSPASSEGSKKKKEELRKMPKVQAIGEQLLKEESNSDNASEADSEVEDLPAVTMPAINGDFVHLAKDDLLEESDSSNEVAEVEVTTEEVIQEDSETEENVKLKRRKANAISSDSDVGSSRKKDKAKNSDFEDSEDDNSEPSKRSKRKKKVSESDGSAASSTEGGKKKRRRIKQVKDSDASGSDTENEGRNKHGRKNIRKVMGKDQLEEATKKAAREEKERIARIAERQKLYNNMQFDESGKLDEVALDKVVLDFNPDTKEPIIEVDRGLVKKLKPHQANGIKFMWDACFESVKRIKKDRGSGCILAHCMGLGKTLQVVTLTHTLLTHADLTGVNRVLVVCPLSTVLNWVNEFRIWLEHCEKDYEVDIYELSRYKQNSERAYQLQQWFENGGVCVLGYEMFRNLSAEKTKKFKKKMLKVFQESLVYPGPDMVVCDEGHLLKNEKTSLSQSMNRIKTRRRIVLTGTPLQNNLKEYYCMVQFVKPNLLGKYNEYLNRFVNPITNGQYTDSTEYDIKVMKRRSHVLHKMLDGAVQRRDYGVLAPFLPPKHEYVLFITLTEVQIKLYEHYLENYSRRPLPGKSSGFLFPDFQSLQRIWTHPLVLQYNSVRYEKKQQKKREREEEEDSENSLADFIDDDSTPEETSTEESLDDNSDFSDDSRKKSKKKSSKKNKVKDGKSTVRRGTRANPVELDDEDKIGSDVEEVKNENPTEWWIKLVELEELEDLRNSHKLVLLFDILKQCEIIGDKLLVFSQSIYSLDLIEHFLNKVDEATQEGRLDDKLGGHVGSWSPGIDYFRLDGSTSCENRSIWCKNFNREDNPRARLFLISTRAGGLGINLVAANRVVIFDVSWNPSHDVQSIFRVYRFGQKKPCYVYRFLAMGTMEEKIYERQVTKQAISKRVIDEQQIDRHYAENDLAELYQFAPRPPHPRPLPALPKDRLFAEMLMEHEQQIYKFHEHDSLLENKEEETLTEEERKAAWEDFENEKNKPPPPPFPSPWPHAGMATAVQQQQQLAIATMTAMLRKDMPNINENQLRDLIPLMYSANPGLMQKMNDIYKYAQPGMMNINSMMNPVMNPGGTGGGMGGTSGLQYEPPWQRQQQQQQQMRLQQLLQQQNQMNAKYYAGGLGSRDPVAMALQQQRAREMMLGERARARGRPPLQPRAPAAPAVPLAEPLAQDVVNLADSD